MEAGFERVNPLFSLDVVGSYSFEFQEAVNTLEKARHLKGLCDVIIHARFKTGILVNFGGMTLMLSEFSMMSEGSPSGSVRFWQIPVNSISLLKERLLISLGSSISRPGR